jgi:hypothetical protein
MRANGGITCDLEGDGERVQKEKSAFQRKGDVNKTCVNDKYDPCRNNCNRGRKDRKTNMEI